MWKMMVLMMMCGVFLTGAAVAADGGEKVSSTTGISEARVFNVLKYGAVGDDKTDNTDIYNVQASKPTHGTRGLVTPACNNAALTILRNVIVTGYHTGILVNEHTDGDNINLASTVNGLEFAFGHHASRFGRVGAQRCTHAVAVTGKHGFLIEQLDMEIAGKNQTDSNNVWQATAYNLNDPNNLGTGDINHWVVEGGVGAIDKFTRNGGASIQVRRIGEKR